MSTDVKIRIELPLPMDVAATMMKLVGLAYPDALMEGNGHSMTFVLPEGARPRKVAKTKAKAETVLDDTTDLLDIGPGGISISTPEHLAAACLQIMRTSFEQYPDAKNYLEQKVYDQATHKHYAMTFQRVEGRSPAELRTRAEDALSVALARIAVLEPYKITTPEELDALPVGSVVKDEDGHAHLKYPRGWVRTGQEPYSTPEGILPAIVIHEASGE